MKKERETLIDLEFELYCEKQLKRLRKAALSLVALQGKPYRSSPDYEKIVSTFFETNTDIKMFNSVNDPRLSLVTSKVAKREMTPLIRVYAANNEGAAPSLMAVLSAKHPRGNGDLIHLAVFSPKDTTDPYMTKVAHRYVAMAQSYVMYLHSQHRFYSHLLIECMENLVNVISHTTTSSEDERNI